MVSIEVPCTLTASSFSYDVTPTLPIWINYTPDTSNPIQTMTIVMSNINFGSLNIVSYQGAINKTGTSISRDLEIIVY